VNGRGGLELVDWRLEGKRHITIREERSGGHLCNQQRNLLLEAKAEEGRRYRRRAGGALWRRNKQYLSALRGTALNCRNGSGRRRISSLATSSSRGGSAVAHHIPRRGEVTWKDNAGASKRNAGRRRATRQHFL